MLRDALITDSRAGSADAVLPCREKHAMVRHVWQIACLSKDVRRKPAQVTVCGRHLVLFRDGSGKIAALEDRCAHRNAPLSIGRICGNRLQCAYHGWEYDRDGSVARIPALPGDAPRPALRTPGYPAVEQQGFVWIALGNDAHAAAPLPFPHFGEPGWTSFTMKTRFHATVEACLENFLDCPHATFEHRFWFRSPTAKAVKAVVTTLADGAMAEFFDEPREKSAVWSLLAPRGGEMRHTDRFIAPATSRVDYRFPNGLHYIITSSCTEINAGETEVFTVISFKFRRFGPLVRLYFEPLSRYIIRQDVRILAAQQANVARFGAPDFASTKADLLGPLIAAWRKALSNGTPPPPAGEERRIDVRL
jgi:phenylpropionate dioxygenase-like ring-hydroxylating dioxygenase large terminal subunit